jgi:hypothetical protein
LRLERSPVHRRRRAHRLAPVVFLAAALGASGCKGCSERKPYTPFSIDGGPIPTTTTTDGATPSGSAASSAFVPVEATSAASGDKFPLEPGSVAAPPGRSFTSGLPLDADGDGSVDLFAWLESSDHQKAELWYTKGTDRAARGVTLATAPKDLSDPSCKREMRLARIGPSTVLARVDAKCPELSSRVWLAVVRLHGAVGGEARDPDVRLEARIGPGLPGEGLSLAVSAADRDGDKSDDLELDLTLDGVGEPYEVKGKITLPVTYLDRPAGFARDPAEPEATLDRAAAVLVSKARSAKTAPDVFAGAAQLTRAATIACDELGAPLLTTSAGAVRCGDVRALGEAIYATGAAGIASGDVAQALAAAGALTELKPATDKRVKDLDAALAKAAPVVDAAIVRRVTATPTRGGVLSPLTFDADRNLLVVTDTGVVRVAASDFAEERSDAVAWPRSMAWQASSTEFALVGAARKCSPPGLVASGKVSGGPVDTLLPTVSGMIPTGARGACHEGDLPLVPLVTSGNGGVVAVGPEVVRVESSGSGLVARHASLPDAKAPPSLPGASRSPDGSAIALALRGDAAQVLVTTPKGSRRLRSDDLRDATACVPRADGDRVACLVKGSVLLAEPR